MATEEERIMDLPVPDEAGLDEGTQRFLGICRERVGFVPNVFRAYTTRPERFRKYNAYRNDLMRSESGLSAVEREMIAVTVSSANRCHYCLVAHGQILRELSGDPAFGDTIVINYRAAKLSPRHRAMLDFAWKLTLTPSDVGDADRQVLRDAGFADGDIFDLVEVAAFYNMTNRFALGLGLEPNAEYYSMSR